MSGCNVIKKRCCCGYHIRQRYIQLMSLYINDLKKTACLIYLYSFTEDENEILD